MNVFIKNVTILSFVRILLQTIFPSRYGPAAYRPLLGLQDKPDVLEHWQSRTGTPPLITEVNKIAIVSRLSITLS